MTLKLRIAIFLIAFCTLVLELSLVRVFDVILTPNMGYAVVTSAVFSLGLGGIYLYILPLNRDRAVALMPWLFIVFALSTLALLPVINALPFNLNLGATGRISSLGGNDLNEQIVSWLAMFVMLILPFFIAGLIISIILSNFSEQVHSLYFFDLVGAGIGCLVLIPLIQPYGPGGIQFLVAGLALIAAVFLLDSKKIKLALLAIGLGLMVFPATVDHYLEYRGHADKRGVDQYKEAGLRDHVQWDPVSKLEVLKNRANALNFAIDGGQQGSWLQAFDGDFSYYDKLMEDQPDSYYFGLNSVAHYFKRGTNSEVLIIGAAVGGETKAAVLFGANHVDSIELVGSMVDAAKNKYGDYSGNVFNHPVVNYSVGEGRTFLRGSDKNYDIIQMFSNHTTSSIADGSGAVGAAYLQTVQAYEEYFSHLNPNGMMQINHHIYPRILTTASEAWRRMGKHDFSSHVLVLEAWVPDTLPTTFIKMQPWTAEEVAQVYDYMNRRPISKRLPDRKLKSEFIYKDHPLDFNMGIHQYPVNAFSAYVSTGSTTALDYDLRLQVLEGERSLIDKTISGDIIHDNAIFSIDMEAILHIEGNRLRVILSSEADESKAISLWMASPDRPHASFRGEQKSYVIAFDPMNVDSNLIPSAFLDQDYDDVKGGEAHYKLSPVTDNNPYFGMLRKNTDRVSRLNSPYMDYGTEYFLNIQKLPFLSSDWLNLFIVASIALVFSLVFVFVPLFFSKHGRARWPNMAQYLIYFCCLGAGFILIELTLIQLFKKLIGYPTHTYATVIFSLLISAGLGSFASKPLRVADGQRWKIMFALIIGLNLLFIFSYDWWFSILLAKPLYFRVVAAALMLAPMGFVMGMPLPIAISKLGQIEAGGIPWAWAMNGFFTVFGGFLSVLIAFTLGFQVTLIVGVSIYLLAFYMYSKMNVVHRIW